jgi:hypothetical protein
VIDVVILLDGMLGLKSFCEFNCVRGCKLSWLCLKSHSFVNF